MTAASITHAAKAVALRQYIERHGGTLQLDGAAYDDLAKHGMSRSEVTRALDHLAAHRRVAVIARGGQVYVGPVAAPAAGSAMAAGRGDQGAGKGRE